MLLARRVECSRHYFLHPLRCGDLQRHARRNQCSLVLDLPRRYVEQHWCSSLCELRRGEIQCIYG